MLNKYAENRNKFISLVGCILFFFFYAIQCVAQSYPFEIKESIYYESWIDLNKNRKFV